MKALLVNLDLGYPIDIWPSRKQSIGLGYVGAVLIEQGHEVNILEERFLGGSDKIFKKLIEEKYDVASFSFTGFELSKPYLEASTLGEAFSNPVSEAVRLIKSTHPETKVILGGYSATFWDREIFQFLPVDFICRGEAEVSIVQLLSAILENSPLEEVRGISWIKNGELCRNPIKLPDLEKLPRPLRLPYEAEDWIMVNSSRGCYGQCTFCSTFALYGEKKGNWWRGRAALSVVSELEELTEVGYSNFQFAEDDFIGTQPERAREIAEEIIKRNISCSLMFDCRVNEVQPDLFRLLREAGLKRVYLGCESGSRRDLRFFRKGTTVEQNIRAVQTLKSLEVEVNPGMIMFHPLSTLETIEDNIQYLEQLGGEPALVELASEIIVYKGTPIHREMVSKGVLNLPLTTYRIIDPRAQWVRTKFLEYAGQEQEKIKQLLDAPYRKGDHLRGVVYQPNSEHFRVFKEIIREARKVSIKIN
jgi:anaerobic magnesium-protoporphyrin IX monomethyl ester cyclase